MDKKYKRLINQLIEKIYKKDFSKDISDPFYIQQHGKLLFCNMSEHNISIACYMENYKLNGEFLLYIKNDTVETIIYCYYINNLLDGGYFETTNFFFDGYEIQAFYKNDLLDGVYTKKRTNRDFPDLICNYSSGYYNGLYLSYHDNGQKNLSCYYVNGEILGDVKRYDRNGILI